jgi:hypothetical protein
MFRLQRGKKTQRNPFKPPLFLRKNRSQNLLFNQLLNRFQSPNPSLRQDPFRGLFLGQYQNLPPLL